MTLEKSWGAWILEQNHGFDGHWMIGHVPKGYSSWWSEDIFFERGEIGGTPKKNQETTELWNMVWVEKTRISKCRFRSSNWFKQYRWWSNSPFTSELLPVGLKPRRPPPIMASHCAGQAEAEAFYREALQEAVAWWKCWCCFGMATGQD